MLGFIFLQLFFLTNVKCAKILAVFPVPSYSHSMFYEIIMLELHSRGHDLLIMTPHPLGAKAPISNYTEIDLSFLYEKEDKSIFLQGHTMYRVEIMYRFMKGYEKVVEKMLSHDNVKEVINGNYQFDLVIVEWSIHASLCAFGELFRCPLVGIRPMVLKLEGYDSMASPFFPSYMPLNDMQFELDFWSRVTNTFQTVARRFVYKYIMLPSAEAIARKHFANHSSYIGDIEQNVSILLVNTYPILTGVVPYVPAIIEIGGIHLQKYIKKSLPKTLKTIMDDAEEGVVLFSFGTVARSWDLPEDKIQMFKNAFAELPYKVIWKWGAKPFKNKSKNIELLNWIPQREVLAHPNLRLFITHGGLRSMEESLAHQIPMLCIPFFADQHCNCRQIYKLGAGFRYELNELTKDILVEAIQEIIQNSSYKQKVKEIGKKLLDQPIPPLEKAVWWIEYVLRHKGANHLRSDAVDMPWYIYYSLDVLLYTIYALATICVLLYSFILLSKYMLSWLLMKRQTINLKID